MQVITTVTQKGQVTIPKKMREKLGIKPRGRALVEIKGKKVHISPAISILDLAGKIKPRANKGVDPVKARGEMEKNYTKYDKRLLERL